MTSELISTGGWCAPSVAHEITSEMIAAWAEQHPVGGPCSDCGGSGEILSHPICGCSMCEADVETLECWHCDGTGVEPECDLEPGLISMLDAAFTDLPTFTISRGGIAWPIT